MRAANESGSAKPPPSLAQTSSALLRHYLGGRKLLALLAVAAVGTGLALNWSWLVAAGIAPILLALAPCAAMCALGLCMRNMGGESRPDAKDASAKGPPSGAPKKGRAAE